MQFDLLFPSRHNPYGREQSEKQAQTMNRASTEENSHGLFYDENNYFIGHHKLRWDRRVSSVVYHTHFGTTHKLKLSYKRQKCISLLCRLRGTEHRYCNSSKWSFNRNATVLQVESVSIKIFMMIAPTELQQEATKVKVPPGLSVGGG